MTRLGILLILVALAPAPDVGAVSGWTIYLRKAGPIRIGMHLREVRRVLNDPAAQLESGDPAASLNGCTYLRSKALPGHLALMFEQKRVVRIDVDGPEIRTASGAGVGDSEDRIKQLYPGRISVEPHPYDTEEGHYLVYTPADSRDQDYGLVFETDGKSVRSFRAGRQSAIGLIEGCS